MGGGSRTQVFISYAHESDIHREQVRDLWVFLRSNGIDAQLDRIAAQVRQDWAEWTEAQIRDSDYVLVVVSHRYRSSAEAYAHGKIGKGVRWEANLMRGALYDNPDNRLRFLPVLLPGHSIDEVPAFLSPSSNTVYRVKEFTIEGAEPLLRLLLGQPEESAPPIGLPPVLDRREIENSGLLHRLAVSVDAVGPGILARTELAGTVLGEHMAQVKVRPSSEDAMSEGRRLWDSLFDRATGRRLVELINSGAQIEFVVWLSEELAGLPVEHLELPDGRSVTRLSSVYFHVRIAPPAPQKSNSENRPLPGGEDAGQMMGEDWQPEPGERRTSASNNDDKRAPSEDSGSASEPPRSEFSHSPPRVHAHKRVSIPWRHRPIWSIDFSPSGDHIAASCSGGRLYLLNVNSSQIVGKPLRNGLPITRATCVRYSPNGERIAVDCDDGVVRVWDSTSGDLVTRLKSWYGGHHFLPCSLAFSADSRRLVTRAASVWDVESGNRIVNLGEAAMAVAVDSVHDRIATGSFFACTIWNGSGWQTGRVWNADEIIPKLREFAWYKDTVKAMIYSVEFSSTGDRLLTASEDGTVRVWDTDSGTEKINLPHDAPVYQAVFSPNEHWILTGCADGQARLWDAHTGDMVLLVANHHKEIRSVAFSTDSLLAVAGSAGFVELSTLDS